MKTIIVSCVSSSMYDYGNYYIKMLPVGCPSPHSVQPLINDQNKINLLNNVLGANFKPVYKHITLNYWQPFLLFDKGMFFLGNLYNYHKQ